MANTILTPTMVTRKALAILHNKLTFLRTINRQYDSQFGSSGGKIGTTLKIRKPNQFTVREGLVMQAQDIAEESQDLVVSTVRGVDVNFDSTELTLSLDDFSARILEPAMARLAAEIEKHVLANVYQNVYNFAGTAATTPASLAAILNAGVKIGQGLAPDRANRHLLVDSVTMAALVDALKALFHRGSDVERAFAQGYYGEAAGLKWWESELVQRHTNGTRTGGTPVVNTAGITSGDATIGMTGVTAGQTLKAGDVFTIADVYAVNPETKTQYDHLQQFVVTADVTSPGNVAVSPALVTSGAKQTVLLVSAGAGKAVTFTGAGSSGAASAVLTQNLAYHRDAFTFVTADLEVPKGVEASRQIYDGISLRYVRDFDIVNSKHPARLDVLFGFKTIRPEWATRVRG